MTILRLGRSSFFSYSYLSAWTGLSLEYHWQHDVFHCSERWDKVELLEHEAYGPAPDISQLVIG